MEEVQGHKLAQYILLSLDAVQATAKLVIQWTAHVCF